MAQTALRQELEDALAARGLPMPQDRIECTSILTMRGLLTDTDVIAVLPLLVAREDQQLALLPTPLEAEQTVGVTTAAGGTMTPAAQLLLEQLDEAAEEIRGSIGSAQR